MVAALATAPPLNPEFKACRGLIPQPFVNEHSCRNLLAAAHRL
jgi:hypothetical protein